MKPKYIVKQTGVADETLENKESGASGVFWVGNLPYGTYYIQETTAPNDSSYSGNKNKWFYLIVHSSGVYMSEEGNADKDAVITAATAKKAELDSST